jgi:hypothetical protein
MWPKWTEIEHVSNTPPLVLYDEFKYYFSFYDFYYQVAYPLYTFQQNIHVT